MTGAAAATATTLSDHRRLAGTFDAVRGHLEALQRRPWAGPANGERYDELLLVLGEVLNNIVEHAFTDGSGDIEGWIDCWVGQEGGVLSVCTDDNGRPLPPDLLIRGAMPDLPTAIDDLPEGGFGWFIIHELVDDMAYERRDGRNRLTFSLAPA